ncbi:MAG: PRC-barrel domain-containing protein [Thiohalomonadaceae bacterium]
MIYRMLAAALALAFATAVYAQSAQQPQAPSDKAPGAVVTPAPDTAGTPTGPMGAGNISPQLAEMTAGEIEGRPLLNAKGDQLGTVRNVVRNTTDGSINAVVGVGGFLGFGQRQVVVPLSEIQFQDNQLVTSMAETRSDLRNRAKAYKADDFQALTEQTRLSEAAAGTATIPGQPSAELGGISFESLDKDSDGFISSHEAAQHEALADLMPSLDTNRDGQLDQAEFAAFSEQMQPAPQSGTMQQQRPRDAMRDEEQLRRRDQMRQREPAEGMR